MKTVMAIDPGSGKCGIAVVTSDGRILHRQIASSPCLPNTVAELYERFKPDAVLVGNGTGARRARECCLARIPAEAPVHLVEERFTSVEARQRYLKDHPPRGWRRLLPAFARVPEDPYDDYVAIILAERYFAALTQPGAQPIQGA
ncbi:MAG: pre-16S rRNA-processing nuclease YqgF [Chthonomonadales bacterium]